MPEIVKNDRHRQYKHGISKFFGYRKPYVRRVMVRIRWAEETDKVKAVAVAIGDGFFSVCHGDFHFTTPMLEMNLISIYQRFSIPLRHITSFISPIFIEHQYCESHLAAMMEGLRDCRALHSPADSRKLI